jgi:hypothetical protein
VNVPIAFKVALHLVLRAGLESFWRSLAILVAAGYAMVIALASLSVFTLLEAEQGRVDGRSPLLARGLEPARLMFVERDDKWGDDQFPVVWLEPVPGIAPVLPPGVSRMLEPGEAAVSPRLDELARKHPELGARYPDRIVIDEEGLQNPGELLAYYRPAAGRTLGDSPLILRVSGFGAYPAELRGPAPGQDPPNGIPVALGLLGLAVLPAMVLVVCGLAALSSQRQHRFQVLQWLGGPPSMLAAISVFETLILLVPAGLAITLAWYGFSGVHQEIPLLGREVAQHGLRPPLWACLVVAGGVVAGAAAISAVRALMQAVGQPVAVRPGYRQTRVSPVRLVILVSPWMLLLLGTWLGHYRGALALMAGLVLMPVATAAAAPIAVRALGRALRRTAAPSMHLAGGRMEWDPLGSGRPFLGFTVLAVLLFGVTGYLTLVNSTDAPRAESTPVSYATVSWFNPRPGDLDRLRATLGDAFVFPLSTSREGAAVIHGSCPELARALPNLPCDPTDTFALSEDARVLMPGFVPPQVPIRLSAEQPVLPSLAIVLAEEPQAALHQRLRTAAMIEFIAPTVLSPALVVKRPPALARWVTAGVATGASALVLGTMILCVNGVYEWKQHLRPLLLIGTRVGQLRRIQASIFALPFMIHVGLGLVVGPLACWFIVSRDADASMPWGYLALITMGFGATGVLGSALLYFFAPALQLRGHND